MTDDLTASNLARLDATTPFESVLLGPTFLDATLREAPVTRFLALRGLVGTFDVTSTADEPSSEYEQSREARLLLAGSLPGPGRLEVTPDARDGWRFTPDVLLARGTRALVDYDCMNSVASRLPHLLGRESASLKLWQITAALMREPARERELFEGAHDELSRYVALTHTIGNFALIPCGSPSGTGAQTYNLWKGRLGRELGSGADRQDVFLRTLAQEWDALPWTVASEDGSTGELPCTQVMPFSDYIRMAQLELYCVGDEAVRAFLDATEGEKDDKAVIAAYESVAAARHDEPVLLGEDDLSYLRAASLRIRARGRLVMARFRLARPAALQ